MTTRAQKKAKHGKGDEGTEAKIDKGEAFSESVLQNLYCPITHQLFVDPHTAEDGNVYEKAAIECWLTSKICMCQVAEVCQVADVYFSLD